VLSADTTAYMIQLAQFEGPLDLLLHLIERSELDITTIALAQVADQYLQYVRAMPNPACRPNVGVYCAGVGACS